METQRLSTNLAIYRRHMLVRVEEILSNLFPVRAAQITMGDPCHSFLENVPEHRAMCTAGAQAEGMA